jgi:hypothetical protein
MKPTIARVLVSLFIFPCVVWIGISLAPSPARGEDAFIRGDANQDGVVSVSDLVFINRWLFGNYGPGGPEPACLATADVNDWGAIDLSDAVAVLNFLFLGAPAPPPPYPEAGPDPTPDPEGGCASYAIQPADDTDDLIALGDVTGAPGEEVKIPVYLTSSIPVTAVQLAVEYDPMILEISSDRLVSLSFEGTFYEQFFGNVYTIPDDSGGASTFRYDRDAVVALLDPRPEAGVFTAAIAGNLIFEGLFDVSPGSETLIAWIHAMISPDAPDQTVVALSPTNGPDGQGVGPYRMRNEITFDGNAKYVSFIPKTAPGFLRVAIVGDITFFIRGDSNRDQALDIADPIDILNFLFLGSAAPKCPDAADADDNGAIEITDAVAVLNFLFLGAAALPPPYPEAGPDPTPDQVGGCGV